MDMLVDFFGVVALVDVGIVIHFSLFWRFVVIGIIDEVAWIRRRLVIRHVGRMIAVHGISVHRRIAHRHWHHSWFHVGIHVVVVHALSASVHAVRVLEYLLCVLQVVVLQHDFLIQQQSHFHSLIAQEILTLVELLFGSDCVLEVIDTEKEV